MGAVLIVFLKKQRNEKKKSKKEKKKNNKMRNRSHAKGKKRVEHHSYKHIVHQSAIAPPVHHPSIPLAIESLRGHVFYCTAKGGCFSIIMIKGHLAQSKICQQDVSRFVEKNIFRLQVSVGGIKFEKGGMGLLDLPEKGKEKAESK